MREREREKDNERNRGHRSEERGERGERRERRDSFCHLTQYPGQLMALCVLLSGKSVPWNTIWTFICETFTHNVDQVHTLSTT